MRVHAMLSWHTHQGAHACTCVDVCVCVCVCVCAWVSVCVCVCVWCVYTDALSLEHMTGRWWSQLTRLAASYTSGDTLHTLTLTFPPHTQGGQPTRIPCTVTCQFNPWAGLSSKASSAVGSGACAAPVLTVQHTVQVRCMS